MTALHDQDPTLLERVLVVVRGGRNGELTRELLESAGFVAEVCGSVGKLCSEIECGAAAAVLTEDVLTPSSLRLLSRTLKRQPAWSDFPLVVVSAGLASEYTIEDLGRVLGNVTYLDRPVRTRSLLASTRSALNSRRRQYEARRAIESRDAFLAMLGHELRNPLSAIRLAITVLDNKADENELPKEYQIIDRQSKHLMRLVDDLLDVARVTHGKVKLQRERLNLGEVVHSVCESLSTAMSDHGLCCEVHGCDTSLWVSGDRQRLDQVLTNLLTNAIKYTPRGGGIEVRVQAEGPEAKVTVSDTGVGIAPELLAKVFEMFAQAEQSRDRTKGGMGLGLTVVRSLVQLHGGTVEAFSAGPGAGSAFVVTLPLLEPTEAQQPVPAPSVKPTCSQRVVVVEDSDDNREMLTELLKLAGHEVCEAETGPQGLECILSCAPDTAFVDIGLPGFDGLELARRARAQGSNARLIALTGYGQSQDRKEALAAGFDEHLRKPVMNIDLQRAMVAVRR